MANIIVECAKYLMIILITMYTYECFTVFGYADGDKKRRILRNQNKLMFMIHFLAFAGMYLKIGEIKILIFYAVQVVLLLAIRSYAILFSFAVIDPVKNSTQTGI